MRKLAALFTALLLFGGLWGCNNQTAPAVSGQDPSDPAQVSSQPATQDDDPIKIWTYFATSKESFETMVNGLAEKLNIPVSYTHYPFAELNKQYTLGLVSGDLPDIGIIDCPDNAMYVDMGMLQDITGKVDEWGEKDKFYESSLSTTTIDGRIYGLPYNSNDLILWYDTDMLESANLTVPKNWDEFENACKVLTEGKRYGFAMSLTNSEEGTFQFMPFLYSAGGSVFEMNSTESNRALSFLTGLVQNGYMSKEVINWSQSDVLTQFEQGNAAMMLSGPWNVPILRERSPDKNWAVAPLPIDKAEASALGGEGFSIMKGADIDKVWPLFQAMFSCENLAAWNANDGSIPSRSDSILLSDVWTEDPIISVFVDQLQYAVPRGPHIMWPEISKAVYTSCQNAISGSKTPEEACAEADATIQALLDE